MDVVDGMRSERYTLHASLEPPLKRKKADGRESRSKSFSTRRLGRNSRRAARCPTFRAAPTLSRAFAFAAALLASGCSALHRKLSAYPQLHEPYRAPFQQLHSHDLDPHFFSLSLTAEASFPLPTCLLPLRSSSRAQSQMYRRASSSTTNG